MGQVIIKYWYFLFPLLLASYCSVGYAHPDEHFQILEFAQYKLGRTTSDILPWEFHSKIRSALQPGLVYVLVKLWENPFGNINPFYFTFFLRFLSSTLSFLSIILLFRAFKMDLKSFKVYYLLSCSLWFMPYVMVRFSSETWSGIFLGFGIYFLFQENRKKLSLFFAGILFGLAILFRIQIAFSIFGILMWLIFYRHFLLASLCSFGLLFTLLFGFAIDHWFYGEYVSTFYQYYFYNIVKGVANSFGTYGIWYYPLLYLIHLFPLISIPFIFLIGRFIYFQRNHIITWAFIPFLFIHFLIPHKEIRFLYPMFIFIPLIIFYNWDYISRLFIQHYKISRAIIGINFILLFIICLKPADIMVHNIKILSQNGEYKKNIYLPPEVRKYYYNKTLMTFYETFDTIPSKNTRFIFDTYKNNSIKVQNYRLIEDDLFKLIYWQKLGDNFELFQWYSCNRNNICTVPKN